MNVKILKTYFHIFHIPTFTTSSNVRMEGLEPTHLAEPEPKSGASTNFATSAFGAATICYGGAKVRIIKQLRKLPAGFGWQLPLSPRGLPASDSHARASCGRVATLFRAQPCYL